jgi:nucleotide-binding universal stress UspA family protein
LTDSVFASCSLLLLLTAREVKMFRKVLYPTDFSDVAGKAMGYLKQLKDAGTEEVVILHVVDARYIHRNLHIPMHYALKDFSELEEKYAIEAQDAANTLAETLTEMGFEVKVRIERGIPFKEILRVESEEDVSLIVIGSHGRSNVEEMLLGSVSEKVIRKAKKPVLVVKR